MHWPRSRHTGGVVPTAGCLLMAVPHPGHAGQAAMQAATVEPSALPSSVPLFSARRAQEHQKCPPRVATAAATGVSRGGLPASSQAVVAHLRVPTEIRVSQRPWELSGSGLHRGTASEPLLERRAALSASGPVRTGRDAPSRTQLLSCPELSRLQELPCATKPGANPFGAGSEEHSSPGETFSFLFRGGRKNFSALPLPLPKSTNHSIYCLPACSSTAPAILGWGGIKQLQCSMSPAHNPGVRKKPPQPPPPPTPTPEPSAHIPTPPK